MKLPTLCLLRNECSVARPFERSRAFELVKTYQIHAHSRTCWKCDKKECHFSYGRYFTEKMIVAKLLDSKHGNDEKKRDFNM